MDISKLSVLELKALARDTLAQIQSLQNDLGALNSAIAAKSNEEAKKQPERATETPEEN